MWLYWQSRTYWLTKCLAGKWSRVQNPCFSVSNPFSIRFNGWQIQNAKLEILSSKMVALVNPRLIYRSFLIVVNVQRNSFSSYYCSLHDILSRSSEQQRVEMISFNWNQRCTKKTGKRVIQRNNRSNWFEPVATGIIHKPFNVKPNNSFVDSYQNGKLI